MLPPFSDRHSPTRRTFVGVAAALNATMATLVSAGVGFNAPVKYPVGGSPFLRVVADFNADGKPDLASSDSTGNTVEVLINNGSGGFTVTSYAVGNQPTNVVACDTNGTGLRDLVVGNKGSNSFSALVNQGGGIFAPAAHDPIGEAPQFVACAGNATNTGHYIRVITTVGNLKEYRDNVGTGNVIGTFRLVT